MDPVYIQDTEVVEAVMQRMQLEAIEDPKAAYIMSNLAVRALFEHGVTEGVREALLLVVRGLNLFPEEDSDAAEG